MRHGSPKVIYGTNQSLHKENIEFKSLSNKQLISKSMKKTLETKEIQQSSSEASFVSCKSNKTSSSVSFKSCSSYWIFIFKFIKK